MKIEILKGLENYPGKGLEKNEPLVINEILELEQLYNQGNPFPKALRELLFLAGRDCNVLDYGWHDTQQEIQEEAREWLTERGLSISRPFFVIDVYNGGEQFLFIYLDENLEDPEVQDAYLFPLDWRQWIVSSEYKLSEFINSRLDDLLKGYNPF